MNDLNKSIIRVRNKLQETKLKKSGKNTFSNFNYYELSDFLPMLNKLMLQEDLNDLFTIEGGYAKLILIKESEKQEYSIPFERFETPKNKSGQSSMQDIQYLGALNTYYKRYLYLNAFGITDGEVIDGMDNNTLQTPKKEPVYINTETIDKIKGFGNLQAALNFYKVFSIEELTQAQGDAILRKMNKKDVGKLSDL